MVKYQYQKKLTCLIPQNRQDETQGTHIKLSLIKAPCTKMIYCWLQKNKHHSLLPRDHKPLAVVFTQKTTAKTTEASASPPLLHGSSLAWVITYIFNDSFVIYSPNRMV